MPGRFLAGIGALLCNPVDDTYLLLRRAPEKDYGAGHWECVTGRVDQGEGFEDALRREVREELGVPVRIEFIIGTSHFYRGDAVPENELVGVIYCCTTPDPSAIRTSPEHDTHRWVTAEEAQALLDEEEPSKVWLRNVIRRADITRHYIAAELRAFHHTNGFETE